jgi:uncharacterized RDD family membrane protein YckC
VCRGAAERDGFRLDRSADSPYDFRKFAGSPFFSPHDARSLDSIRSAAGRSGRLAIPMKPQSKAARRRFHAHAGARAALLDGMLLATFWQRLVGYLVDLLIAVLIWFPLEFCWRRFLLHETNIHMAWDFHEAGNIVVMVLYWGLAHYFGNGQTPGKLVARTRVLSLTSERMGLWQSVERGLGYGAAVLELGLGFLQFFWDPNRMCAQDRLAETIVIDVRKNRPPSLASSPGQAEIVQAVSGAAGQ